MANKHFAILNQSSVESSHHFKTTSKETVETETRNSSYTHTCCHQIKNKNIE